MNLKKETSFTAAASLLALLLSYIHYTLSRLRKKKAEVIGHVVDS